MPNSSATPFRSYGILAEAAHDEIAEGLVLAEVHLDVQALRSALVPIARVSVLALLRRHVCHSGKGVEAEVSGYR